VLLGLPEGLDLHRGVGGRGHRIGLLVDTIEDEGVVASHLLDEGDDLGALLIGHDRQLQGQLFAQLRQLVLSPLAHEDECCDVDGRELASALQPRKCRAVQPRGSEAGGDEIAGYPRQYGDGDDDDERRMRDDAGDPVDDTLQRSGVAAVFVVQPGYRLDGLLDVRRKDLRRLTEVDWRHDWASLGRNSLGEVVTIVVGRSPGAPWSA